MVAPSPSKSAKSPASSSKGPKSHGKNAATKHKAARKSPAVAPKGNKNNKKGAKAAKNAGKSPQAVQKKSSTGRQKKKTSVKKSAKTTDAGSSSAAKKTAEASPQSTTKPRGSSKNAAAGKARKGRFSSKKKGTQKMGNATTKQQQQNSGTPKAAKKTTNKKQVATKEKRISVKTAKTGTKRVGRSAAATAAMKKKLLSSTNISIARRLKLPVSGRIKLEQFFGLGRMAEIGQNFMNDKAIGDALLGFVTCSTLAARGKRNVGFAKHQYVNNETIVKFLLAKTAAKKAVDFKGLSTHTIGDVFEACLFLSHTVHGMERAQKIVNDLIDFVDGTTTTTTSGITVSLPTLSAKTPTSGKLAAVRATPLRAIRAGSVSSLPGVGDTTKSPLLLVNQRLEFPPTPTELADIPLPWEWDHE